MEGRIMMELAKAIEAGEEASLVTIVHASGSTPGREGNMMAVFKDGRVLGTTGGGNLEYTLISKAKEAMEKGKNMELEFGLREAEQLGMKCGGQVRVYIKVFKKSSRLILVGGGHVGYEVYTLAKYLGFSTTVIDDRQEYASLERFPEADELISGDIGESLRNYPLDKNCYVVIATRGHKGDMDALREAVQKETAYVGMIGSRGKVHETFEKLKSEGISEEELKKVYSPIGLDIASRESKEIAVGIIGEMLMVKNNGTGSSMKKK